jgi:hypothetical protein
MAKLTRAEEALARFAYHRGFSKGRLGLDSEPTKQFEREQLAGEDDEPQFPAAANYPALVEKLESLGLSEQQIEGVCRAVGKDRDMSCDADDPDTALREFLAGRLDDDEIEKAVALAAKDRASLAKDNPPPFSGRPNPGSKMDPIVRNAATGARDQALAAVRRIPVDTSIGVQNFGAPAVNTPRRFGADTSSRSLAGFASRWPEVARIKQAI